MEILRRPVFLLFGIDECWCNAHGWLSIPSTPIFSTTESPHIRLVSKPPRTSENKLVSVWPKLDPLRLKPPGLTLSDLNPEKRFLAFHRIGFITTLTDPSEPDGWLRVLCSSSAKAIQAYGKTLVYDKPTEDRQD